jgi:hypothetical protein
MGLFPCCPFRTIRPIEQVTGRDGKGRQMFSKIVAGLADLDDAGIGAGADGDAAARAGFLEWVFTLPQDVRPGQAAREVLAHWDYDNPGPAVTAFLDHIEAATRHVPTPQRRGGAAGRRVLH